MIQAQDVSKSYESIPVIKNINLELKQGSIFGLIGANGAGKTSILHTITGIIQAKLGSVSFEDIDITKKPSHKIVAMGMAHVPEGRRVFSQLTVLENL